MNSERCFSLRYTEVEFYRGILKKKQSRAMMMHRKGNHRKDTVRLVTKLINSILVQNPATTKFDVIR